VSLQIRRALMVANSVNKHTQQNVTPQQEKKQSHSDLETILVTIYHPKKGEAILLGGLSHLSLKKYFNSTQKTAYPLYQPDQIARYQQTKTV